MLTTQVKDTILKEMWRLDEKDKAGEKLTHEELIFWKNNIKIICTYYLEKYDYWYFNSLKNNSI